MRILYKIIRNHKRQGVPSVYIQVDNEKYFFNLPETTQRFIKEHGLKFSKDMRFFFSNLTTNHLMGSIGLFLTLFQHQLALGSFVYGPAGITQFFRDIRYLTGIKLNFYGIASIENQEEKEIPSIKDEAYLKDLLERKDALEIFMQWDNCLEDGKLDKSKLGKPSDYLGKSSIFEKESVEKYGLRVYSDKVVEIFFVRLENNSSVYVFIPKKIKGNFVPSRLENYGITGKLMKTLVENGKIIVEKDGAKVTVSIDELREEDTQGPAIVIVDLGPGCNPEILLKNETLNFLLHNEMENEAIGNQYYVSEIIHFADYKTVSTSSYQDFIR